MSQNFSISLKEDESVSWSGSPNKKKFFASIISSLLFSMIIIGIGFFINQLLISVLIALLSIVVINIDSYLRIKNTDYIVTDKRVIKKYEGLISTDYQDVSLEKIQNTGWEQGFIEGLFDLGTVEISSAGSRGNDIVFKGIYNPKDTRDSIMNATKESSNQNSKSEDDIDRELKKELNELNTKLDELIGDNNG